ncbi:hypothetical protein ACQ4LE_002179 [Meloidogyne hapla]
MSKLIFFLILPIFIPLISSFGGTIDRFETNLDRFAKGPPTNIKPSRIIIPTNFMEKLKNSEGIQLKRTEKTNFEEENINKLNNNNLNKNLNQPKIRILTNPNIPIDKPLNKNNERKLEENNYLSKTTQINNLIPQIIRGEDKRPFQEGERLGQQGKFAGPTNQYKEDWGQKFTQRENKEMFQQVPGFISSRTAQIKIEKDINPNLDGAKVIIDTTQNSGQLNGQISGRISPYLNAPEELTGSRWRGIDEYFNNLNKGNRGRGPNRYVKIDLLNE